MEKRKRGRPPKQVPYFCGPYKHGRKWRLVVVTGRSGRRRESYVRKFDTRQEAIDWLRGYKLFLAAKGRTVSEAALAYLEHLKRKGNKDGSITTAKYRLAALLDGTMALVDLTASRAQDLYDDMVDEEYAADTHRGSLVSARAFGRFCVSKTWLPENPFEDVQPVGRKSKGKPQLRVDEARKFQAHCRKAWDESRDRTAVAGWLALMFSLRATEVSQLQARDVDDKGRILLIAEHERKTEAARRTAQVPAKLVPVLLELAEKPATADGHLFAKEDGSPADRYWVRYWVRRHCELAGVPIITAHGMRGTAATIGSVATGGAKVMAEALGHESESMTRDAYIKSGALEDATAQRVADLLNDSEDPE